MANTLHPQAKIAIDSAGEALLKLLVEPEKYSQKKGFPSQRPISANLTDKDLIGLVIGNTMDRVGIEISVSFYRDGKSFSFNENDFPEYIRFVEKVNRTPPFNSEVSFQYLQRAVLDWCAARMIDDRDIQVTEFIQEQLNKDIGKFVVLIPIGDLEIESAFEMGIVKFHTITSEDIDQFQTRLLKFPKTAKDEDSINLMISKFRGEVQGLCGAKITLTGEIKHVSEFAQRLINDAIGFLRFYSKAALIPQLYSSIAPIGEVYQPSTYKWIMPDGDGQFLYEKSLLAQKGGWRVNNDEINFITNTRAFKQMASLLDVSELNDFQKLVRKSLLNFTRGLTFTNTNDRLIYTFSALESLLLKDKSEPVQVSIGDRLAFVLGRDADTRTNIVNVIKESYRIRSDYIHHQITSDNFKVLEVFMQIVSDFFELTLNQIEQFETKRDFVEALDRHKYS